MWHLFIRRIWGTSGSEGEARVVSESEAHMWVPVVVEELGSGNEAVRGAARRVVRGATSVYGAASVLGMLLERCCATRNVKVFSKAVVKQ